MGRNRFVDAVVIPTLSDYLHLYGYTPAYERFLGDVALVRTRAQVQRWGPEEQGQLLGWLKDRPLQVVRYAGAWPQLMEVLDYLLHRHERGRYYVRELPVAVPTKFVETHRPILDELLQAVLPDDRTPEPTRGKYALRAALGPTLGPAADSPTPAGRGNGPSLPGRPQRRQSARGRL